MTHHVHPYAHRLAIIRDWKSRWFVPVSRYADYVRGDLALRNFLKKELRGFYTAHIEIERSDKMLKIIIKTARPGVLIGRNGEGTVRLHKRVVKELQRKKLPIPEELKIDIEEVRHPETNAAIVAYMVAEGLERRLPFRRVIKQTLDKVMASRDVRGARIAISGRLGGAEMSRREQIKEGNIPLQTFRSDVDFARENAYLPYGVIGVKVWIYKGEIFEKEKQPGASFK